MSEQPKILRALRARLPSDVWTLEHDAAQASVIARRAGSLAFKMSAYLPIEHTGGDSDMLESILAQLAHVVRLGDPGMWRLLVHVEFLPEGTPRWAMKVIHPLDV